MYGFGCDAIINPKIKNLPYLYFVYKKSENDSENDKEYTEYKEKIRYILCLKIFVETIYRIIHRVGIIKKTLKPA